MENRKFYYTAPFSCGYFSKLEACYVLLDPKIQPDSNLQTVLSEKGFRRSGDTLYFPWCNDCKKCIPIRIKVEDFKLSRSQKRCLKKNRNTKVISTKPKINEEIFKLYQDYQAWKHPGAGMDNCNEVTELDFLTADWSDTEFNLFYQNNQLIGVAVSDYFTNAMSAVYTFYHQDYADYSLGTYAILWQIQKAKSLKLGYLYLGYYLKTSEKMSYKAKFKPHQLLVDNNWQ